MKNEKSLSDLHRLYVEGELEKRDFEGKVFQYLLESHEKYRVFSGDRDSWEEFLGWLYPKLARALDRYREQGSCFDAYIAGLILNASKEYRQREANHCITEYACWKARTEEMVAYDAEPEYFDDRKETFIPKGIKPRQILLLLLKSYYFATDEMIKRTADATGVNVEAIRAMVEEIRKRRSEHEVEILSLRERVYSQHYRCLAYEKRMNAALPGTDYHARMKERFERARKRFRSMKNRLGKMRVSASNRIISEVTGIPKGTIDSSLFSIRNHLAPFTGD